MGENGRLQGHFHWLLDRASVTSSSVTPPSPCLWDEVGACGPTELSHPGGWGRRRSTQKPSILRLHGHLHPGPSAATSPLTQQETKPILFCETGLASVTVLQLDRGLRDSAQFLG